MSSQGRLTIESLVAIVGERNSRSASGTLFEASQGLQEDDVTKLMADIAIASDDLVNPGNLACNKANPGCSTGIRGYNNGNDFGYYCGSDGLIWAWKACSCKNCCHLIQNGKKYTC
ncbi:hypothetical protein EDB19DRAFT_1832392 [Suillus lakei]|nr:hypothetical protein EDB19DRAFT_1832392 [Suillus lakei]